MTSILRAPRFWVVTVAALLVAAGTWSLGEWQLRRAAQKISLQAAIDSQTSQPLLDNASLAAFPQLLDAVHRQATLRGVWRPAETIFLDNRPMGGKSGFVVVTPLLLEASPQAILVERGWVPRNFMDRTRLPEIITPQGVVTVHGRIAPPPSKLYEFKGLDTGRIRQNLDTAGFAREISVPLMAVSLLQTGSASEGLLRDWPPPNLGLEKHYGYAFQWFGLCALVVFLYVWFQVFIPLRQRRSLRLQTSKSTDADES